MNSCILVLSRNVNLLEELSAAVPQLKFKNLFSGIPTKQLEESSKKLVKEKLDEINKAEIIVADFDFIAPFIHDLPMVKWVQGTWAGVDSLIPQIDKSKIDSLPLVTRFSGSYFGALMSEYIIAQIINYERDFYNCNENQKSCLWKTDGKISNHRSVADLTVGVMGIGQIGSRVAKTLNFLGAKVLAYGRQVQRNNSVMNFLSGYYTLPSLTEFLKEVNYIVNILPSTPETKGLLNGNVLKNCSDKCPVFINIGRGSIINDSDLINCLNKKWISAAILDVFNEEPLPQNSPLWTSPQVRITPHVSGVTRSKDVANLFKENYELYVQNKPISTTVDFKRGY